MIDLISGLAVIAGTYVVVMCAYKAHRTYINWVLS